ncbi:hypothetical protein ACA30_09010 [Virgibacillus soli]|uniref:Tissue inhibitor of metalloproteinase n=1 Tax=Lederbergia galactosidilytica TaxID=217031 RepID=A0A0Q9XSK4_9BACI|nr:hypothetical protein ACA29_19485 [Lederbergia galactosidilytica]KRG14933.1 hypothetical protein ACA30_09010 [Virgibacillus soli]OAK69167.1 hypothetical protein ABB05_13865 [Lederbergia galactosidilytica]
MLLLSLFSFLHLSPIPAQACSCAELPGVEEEFERSTAVFSGKVIDIREKTNSAGFNYKSILFQVIQTWKGVNETQVIITTGLGGGDCGFAFKEGQEYLVYAYESDMYVEKALSTVICDRTNELRLLEEDLASLDEGQAPREQLDLTEEQEDEQEGIHEKRTLSSWYVILLGVLLVVGLLALIYRRKRI